MSGSALRDSQIRGPISGIEVDYNGAVKTETARIAGGELRRELRPLTALRFAAALLVFVYHQPATSAFGMRYALGQAGVGFFFVLSGFILMYAYQDVFGPEIRRAQVRDFYTARFARVYPTYVVAMFVSLGALVLAGGIPWDTSSPLVRSAAFAAQALLVQSWFPFGDICLGINSPAWSVSTEAFFYVLLPLIAHTLVRHLGGAGIRKIFCIATLIWAVPAAVMLIPHPISIWATYIFPPVRLVDFAVGAVGGLAYRRVALRKYSRRLWTALEMTAIAVVVVSIIAATLLPEALRYGIDLIPAWIVLIVVLANGRGRISALLGRPLFHALGRLSYSFYLLHMSIIALVGLVLHQNGPFAFAISFALTLGASYVLYHAVERPWRTRLRAALSSRNSTEFALPAERALVPEMG